VLFLILIGGIEQPSLNVFNACRAGLEGFTIVEIKQPNRAPLDSASSEAGKPGILSKINVWRSLKSHALAAAAVTLSVLGLGAAVLSRHSAYYEATSVIYVSPTFPTTLTLDHEQERPYDSYIEEQAHTITRYDVIAEAVRRLKPGVWQVPGESEESAVERLQKSVNAKRDGDTYQVEITLGDYQPQHMAEIVNTVTNVFLEKVKNEEFYGRDDRLLALRQARAEVQKELDDKLREQSQLSQNLGVAVINDDSSDQLDAQVTGLQDELSKARTARIQAEANLSALENQQPGASTKALDAAADEIIATDTGLAALKMSLSQKRALLLDQLAGLTPNHPLRKTTEEQLAEIESSLQQMQTNLRRQASINLEQKLRTEVKRTETVESQLLAYLQSYTHQATAAAPSFQRAAVLKADIATLQARYAALDERTRNLELESSSPGSVHLFAPARTPKDPVPSKAKKLGPAVVPVALVLGLLTAVLIDFLDPRIYSAIDIERILGFTPIGTIFDNREVAMQIFDEGILRMAAAVDQAVRQAGVQTVVLTAAHPGAGTTAIVANLGSTLAKLGRKTLAIDASGAKPPVAYITVSLAKSIPGERGTQRMRSDFDMQSPSVVTESLAPKLPHMTGFMDQAFKDVTNQYDIVLIDATPITISAETEYLSRLADVTILVSEAGRTTGPQLLRCARLLERLQVNGIAAIINKVSLDRAGKNIQEDVGLFEARANKENLAWKPAWIGVPPETGAAVDHREQPATAARETSTYA
jgi:Mrp family chromosome partitioning ATPase